MREGDSRPSSSEPRNQPWHPERRGSCGGRSRRARCPRDCQNRNVIERRLPNEAMVRPRHPIRQTRDRLPSCRPHSRRDRMDPRIVQTRPSCPSWTSAAVVCSKGDFCPNIFGRSCVGIGPLQPWRLPCGRVGGTLAGGCCPFCAGCRLRPPSSRRFRDVHDLVCS